MAYAAFFVDVVVSIFSSRFNAVQDMDRVLVFHKGQLREEGTHQQLLAQKGIYHRLYELQYGDQERPRVPH